MSSMLKNLLVLLALIGLGALGYFLFFNGDSGSIVTSGGAANVNSQAAFQTREFRSILNDLNRIDLDTDLLQDPNFIQLHDHSQPIVERPFGRENPFVER